MKWCRSQQIPWLEAARQPGDSCTTPGSASRGTQIEHPANGVTVDLCLTTTNRLGTHGAVLETPELAKALTVRLRRAGFGAL